VLSFSIRYVIPNFVEKQFDDYIVHLTYENTEDEFKKGISNDFYFQDEQSIPKNIPSDVEIKRVIFLRDNKPYYRWHFKFEGDTDRIFFFNNHNELKEKEENLQGKYLWRGFFLGMGASILLLFLELLFAQQIRFLLRKGWNKVWGRTSVYANKSTKKFHLQNCPFVDNIREENSVIFTSMTKAKEKQYKECSLCFKLE